MDVHSRPDLGDEDYDYPDDFTDETDDQDIPLPGLHALPGAGHWPRGGDWRLPGLIAETADGADSSANAYPGLAAPPSASELMSESTPRQRINPSAAAQPPASDPFQRDTPWTLRYGPFGSPYEAAPATLRTHAAPQLRPSPHTPLRTALFSPLSGGGASSSSSLLQHRESQPAGPRHPLSLSTHHHHLPLPQRQSYPASPSVSHSWRQQPPEPHPPRQHFRQFDRAVEARGDPDTTAPSPAAPAESAGSGPAASAGDGSGIGSSSRWSFRGATERYRSSSCSSSASSRDVSPPDRLSASHYSSLAPTRSTSQQPWYGSRFANALFETGDALDEPGELLGPGMGGVGPAGRASGAAGGGRGVLGREAEERSSALAGLGLGLGGLNGGRRHSPTPSVSSRSSSSSGGSSHSSWMGVAAGREDRAPAAGSVLPQLSWPLGDGTEYGARSRRPDSPSVGGASDWRLPPPEGQQQHAVRGALHGGGAGGGWRPMREEDGQDLLAGPSSSRLPSVGEPSWERSRYGAGVSTAGSISLPHGTAAPRSPIAGRFYNSSAALGGSGLLGTGSLGSGSFTGMSPMGSNGPGHTLSAGMGVLSGGPGDLSLRINPSGGGGANCYNSSLDSPVAPYDRRRSVLTSAHRRLSALDSPAPSARQYSDGLAGMLTNAQIQEWMSQHASRLLLPRHMHEIADIVFRPPSAVPEKKPPKCKPGSSLSTSLQPPVVLGGRGPPPHVTRLASDTGFMMSLLSGLAGVDPANSRVQAVVTALQGKEVNVREAAVEAWPPQRPGSAQRPRSGAWEARTVQPPPPMLSAP